MCFLVDLIGLPSLKTIVIGDKTFSEATEFKVANCDSVETIEIGDECFGLVKLFEFDGLKNLKTLKIGKNSFTQAKTSGKEDISKSFHIRNCESLEIIEIGRFSFSDFSGGFELKNLPKLKTLIIGTIISDSNFSFNFHYSSFIIQGIAFPLNIEFVDFPNLQTIKLGDQAFYFSSTTIFESIELNQSSH